MAANSVNFFYQDIQFTFAKRNALKTSIVKMFKEEGCRLGSLNVIFCTDEALLQINRDFLNHDYYTDIITFPIDKDRLSIEAELYISIERVKENAKEAGVSFKEELHRVIFHGCLHLMGYNDKSSQQIKKMREREDHYLRLYVQ